MGTVNPVLRRCVLEMAMRRRLSQTIVGHASRWPRPVVALGHPPAQLDSYQLNATSLRGTGYVCLTFNGYYFMQ